MKVKDLIELLKDYDEDAVVVMQGGDEGNYYRTLRGAQEDFYIELDGEQFFRSHYGTIEDMAEEFDEDPLDIINKLEDIVIIY